ncbi:MAG TPA: T9SS type A sorting domain-containing protein [Bacteroidia bacterium]|nr:T9SS type A sorting domain-containing protein [Bacteroidia bacterium]
MKKTILNAAALIAVLHTGMAQTPFFQPTTYRGAFAPAPTPMWTDTWCEWDPQNKVYPAPTMTVTSNITTNTTWTTGQVILLSGQIFVKNNAVLTIQPGVIIRGDKSVTGAGLFITRGSKIIAQGTVNQPIVFTSDQAPGSRNIGDWGGVVLFGYASTNDAGGTNYIEGLPPSPDTQYGGGTTPNDNDSSGILKYVRIEFAGYAYQPNKEINGLTFGAVGRKTVVDYVQVSFANDDAFEWFGGTVNCKHLVSYRNLDDDFDTDNGFSGMVQFALAVRDPNIADNPSVSTSEGFESDNDPTGSSNTPKTSAIFSNVTIIGPYRGNTSNTIASGFRRGARLRRNSELKIFNSIFMDHPRGVMIDGTACENNATNGLLKFKNNIVAGNLTGKVTEVVSGSSFNAPAWFGANNNDSLVSTSGILVNPYDYYNPDYRPVSSGIANSGANFNDPAFTGLVLEVSAINNPNAIGKIYPNPAKDIVVVSTINPVKEIVIMDITGKEVLKLMNEHVIDVSKLDVGIYMIKATTENQQIFVTKLIKE